MAFEGLVENAISAYNQKMIDEERLTYLLSLVQKSPSHFGFSFDQDITDEEWDSIMEDYDGDD